ncbi:transketolase C-terminal domain-containing protein [uncultured Sphaerochaeta sp.]|uniref:transketolase family protein n=1 Tax=uncultured Sphaerochaeta sp. TaxID=886478 RepID=UPI002A0A39BD|nr:transketolase C-terminal domain-containing protein [uncultured Sphaerochaeta sp.]
MKDFKGTREAFASAINDMADEGKDIMFISPDSLKAMRAVPFAEQYPDRYVEVGIAEQCSVDVAAGLSTCGITPFVATYAGFLTMRACEQMRTFVAYPNLNVKFLGVNAGLIGGEREGVTHQFYEDLGILSSIPNFTIFIPADAAQTYWAVRKAYEISGPVYIRAASGRENDIYDRQAPFSMDGVTILKDYGKKNVIFASGFILDRVLEAAELLKQAGIGVTVADVNILHGKNPEKIVDLIKQGHKLFTVEDHNINGGLGSYICQLSCENDPKSVTRIGLTSFGESGMAKELADSYGFSPENICGIVKNNQ